MDNFEDIHSDDDNDVMRRMMMMMVRITGMMVAMAVMIA